MNTLTQFITIRVIHNNKKAITTIKPIVDLGYIFYFLVGQGPTTKKEEVIMCEYSTNGFTLLLVSV